MMKTQHCRVTFLTPAFLGNAEQDGQWRTPPFKHLLREWWRVAWAEANGYCDDIDAMRAAEGALFGSAADGSGSKSRVRLRLDRWDMGRLNAWEKLASVSHPEVSRPVDAGLYLGYGPLLHDRQSRRTRLKANAAIQAGESAELRLAFPEEESAALLEQALALMDAYGALGGRARNGWGSLALEGVGGDARPPLRAWRDCLDRDWPHAIGRDDRGALIWRTEPFDDWQSLMRRLAELKIGLRTQFRFHSGRHAHRPEERHWLAYPVTKHNVTPWDKEARRMKLGSRLPNSLRFKARQDERSKLRGVIFHVPCLPPQQFHPDRNAIERVWRQVHDFLDGQSDLERSQK